jgi:hypothetical protein
MSKQHIFFLPAAWKDFPGMVDNRAKAKALQGQAWLSKPGALAC